MLKHFFGGLLTTLVGVGVTGSILVSLDALVQRRNLRKRHEAWMEEMEAWQQR